MSIESLKTKSDLSLEELNQLIKNETDVKIYKKLNFIKLKKEGYSTKQAYQKKINCISDFRPMGTRRIQ